MECDVLVVGAGPAGVSAAYFSKYFAKDSRVCLVERLKKTDYYKYQRMCGQGVSAELIKDISPIKINGIINEISAIREIYPDGTIIETKLEGYIIDRPVFFESIINEYKKLGGEFIVGAVCDFEQHEEKIKVKLSNGNIIRCKYLIAADGASSIFRKRLISGGEIKLILQYLIDKNPENVLVFEYDELYEGDYKWIFPCGRYTTIGFPFIKNKQFMVNGKVLEKHARNIAFGILERYVFGNVLLVGDAACQCNPLSKGGIRPGMVAGRMAAEAVAKNVPEEYNKRWKMSDFGSPIFMHAFERLKAMKNSELAKHIEPFKNSDLFSEIKALLFYREYLDLYKAYQLLIRVGW
jgi:flavin-dependent dehydrogenase